MSPMPLVQLYALFSAIAMSGRKQTMLMGEKGNEHPSNGLMLSIPGTRTVRTK